MSAEGRPHPIRELVGMELDVVIDPGSITFEHIAHVLIQQVVGLDRTRERCPNPEIGVERVGPQVASQLASCFNQPHHDALAVVLSMAIGEAEERRGQVLPQDVGDAVGRPSDLDAFGQRACLRCALNRRL